ncbi:hypothetical protein RX398_04210 [Collinsella aerofaciens]|uniref:hypothetical protein n=1 Tax=Collinsella aerofaciens TaxID=74426 RepID=UPI00290BFA06|nr:hypothetical protein [Collinsella aerofaciens]MDU8576592.1 hypothetical protein [Collinsella aerofaciens]
MQPTITLCDLGNHLADADGRPYCHGLANANRLHFRWAPGNAVLGNFRNYGRMLGGHGGQLECLLLDEPTDYLSAPSMDGWRPLRRTSSSSRTPPTSCGCSAKSLTK